MSDEKPAERVVIDDWRGLITNRDPRDGDSALVDVQNVVFDKAGEARVRAGHKQVTLANDAGADTSDIVVMAPFHSPGFDWVMVQDDGGDVRAGSNPTV